MKILVVLGIIYILLIGVCFCGNPKDYESYLPKTYYESVSYNNGFLNLDTFSFRRNSVTNPICGVIRKDSYLYYKGCLMYQNLKSGRKYAISQINENKWCRCISPSGKIALIGFNPRDLGTQDSQKYPSLTYYNLETKENGLALEGNVHDVFWYNDTLVFSRYYGAKQQYRSPNQIWQATVSSEDTFRLTRVRLVYDAGVSINCMFYSAITNEVIFNDSNGDNDCLSKFNLETREKKILARSLGGYRYFMLLPVKNGRHRILYELNRDIPIKNNILTRVFMVIDTDGNLIDKITIKMPGEGR